MLQHLVNSRVRELEGQLGGLNVESEYNAVWSRPLPHVFRSHNQGVLFTSASHSVPGHDVTSQLMTLPFNLPASHKELLIDAGPNVVWHVMLSNVYNPVQRICPGNFTLDSYQSEVGMFHISTCWCDPCSVPPSSHYRPSLLWLSLGSS